MIEDPPVALLQVVETVDDAGKDGALDFHAAVHALLLE